MALLATTRRLAGVVLITSFAAACATWSYSSVDLAPGAQNAKPLPKKAPSEVMVTTGDIVDRPYKVLGEIKVTVNKTTISHDDPTAAQVDQKLREEAGAMGADAVVLVRYGSVGIGFATWGSLEGRGRAVAYVN